MYHGAVGPVHAGKVYQSSTLTFFIFLYARIRGELIPIPADCVITSAMYDEQRSINQRTTHGKGEKKN